MSLHLQTMLLFTTKGCRKTMHVLKFRIVKIAPAANIYDQIKRTARVSSSYVTINTKSTYHENITILCPTYRIYLKSRLF